MEKWRDNVGQIIEESGEEDTFGNMRSRAIRTSIKLKSMGFARGDMISTCSENQINSCIPEIASFFMGAIPSYFDPNLPELDTIYLLKLMQPKIIFVSLGSLNSMETCLSKANVGTKIVVFGNHDKYISFSGFLEPSPEEKSFTPVEIRNMLETAVILFSSGTTGNPKGICLSHYTLLFPNIYRGIDEVLSGSKSVYLFHSTLYWISGLGLLIKSILSGGTRIICVKFDPSSWWNIIQRYKVELVFLTPYHGIDCLKCKPPKVDTSSMKVIATGASMIPKNFLEDLHKEFPTAKIINSYAMTEVGAFICNFKPAIPEELEMQRKKPQSVGKILPYLKWKVVDPESGKVLGPNQKGELLVKSDILMVGYYKMDCTHVYDHEGYMKTGDIVYYDEDNCFYVEGRIKEMFKYRGWHIVPSILEEVVLKHPAVKQAAIIGVPHEEDEHRPMAVVVLKDNCQGISSEEILDFVNSRVSDAQQLRAGLRILTNDLPKTVTGKLKRQSIKEMVLNS